MSQIMMFDPESKLKKDFKKFHRKNPHVYEKLKQLALDLKRKGRDRYTINGLFEVLRWHYAMRTNSDDEFKLNNNHRAYYARELMRNVSELYDFFETRFAKGDS